MNILIWFIFIFIFLADQSSKILISQNLGLNDSVSIIRDVFHITLVHNRGAAFGIFKNQTLFFTIISVVAIAAILFYLKKRKKSYFIKDTALALILGGALGNLIDRLRFGYVIDFLDFRVWPVFNIADSAITIGAILFVLTVFYKK